MPNRERGGFRGLMTGIANFGRNVSQMIPGGAEAFPLEANGTINWRGENSVGTAMGAGLREASGIDAVTSGVNTVRDFGRQIGSLFRGGQGSVVGRGFVGGNAGMGPTAARPTNEGNGFLQGGWGGGSAGRDPNYRMPGVRDWAQGASGAARAATDARNSEIANEARGTTSNIEDFRNGGGSSQGRSTAHVLGGDVSLAEHMARQRMRAESER